MDRKAVFFDIDGTLYNDRLGVLQSTKDALRKLRENGHYAFVSTGRSPAMVTDSIREIGFDGILAGCGTYIEYAGKVLKNYKIEKRKAEQTIHILEENKVVVIGEGPAYIYFRREDFKGELKVFCNFMKGMEHTEKSLDDPEICVNKFTCKVTKEEDFDRAFKKL